MIYELILNCQLQIGIIELLIDDPCFRSMPRIDYCLVGKRKEFVADGGNQYLLVSTPKVGTADTSGKQCIADDRKAVLVVIESDAAG